MPSLRLFSVDAEGARTLADWPASLPERGFVWISCAREDLAALMPQVQACLQRLCGQSLVDLHVSDLHNAQLPSHFEPGPHYDLMVFRRLAHSGGESAALTSGLAPPTRGGPPILRRIVTQPVACVVLDRVLLSVHPSDCAIRDQYVRQLLQPGSSGLPAARSSLPLSSADLMLRLLGLMVDAYLDLRRELSRQLEHWQAELLHPRTRFNRWEALLNTRVSLHQLESVCDDQHQALKQWLEGLDSWHPHEGLSASGEHDLLRIRSRDVLEHIDRVVQHVRRLEQHIETAVQMHFNMQSARTNDIMRVLTVLTAIFLPLNLIAGIFGMNFEYIPWLHQVDGFWWTLVSMGGVALVMGLVFWRKRYLSRHSGS